MTDFRNYIDALTARPEEFGPKLSKVFRSWRSDENVSCVGFARLMAQYAGLPENPEIEYAALAALQLANEASENGYHNQHHNREVIALTLALMIRHGNKGYEPMISVDMMWLTLAAAAIHDYKHDGTSNRLGGEVYPMRLERLALNAARPKLMEAGLSEKDWLKLSMIVLPTDITPTDLPSPSAQLRDIFRYNSGQQKEFGTVDPLFLSLIFDPELSACGEILSDADLGISAGLDPDMTSVTSRDLAEETKGLVPNTPQSLKGFLDHVCKGFPGSPSGQALLSDGFASIRASNIRHFEHGLSPEMR